VYSTDSEALITSDGASYSNWPHTPKNLIACWNLG